MQKGGSYRFQSNESNDKCLLCVLEWEDTLIRVLEFNLLLSFNNSSSIKSENFYFFVSIKVVLFLSTRITNYVIHNNPYIQ